MSESESETNTPREHAKPPDEDSGQTQHPVADQSDKSPDELERDIEATRGELGETVDALAQKADVKAQVTEKLDQRKGQLRAKQEELKQKLSSGDGEDGGPSAEQLKHAAGQVAQRADEQPRAFIAGAFTVGVAVGLVLRGRS